MARIRTIKPEFFKHGELFDAEKSSRLPLRVAFAGLWCQCDREGRFAWKPRELKLDVLPYDEVDFSRVLDALTTHGFVVKYACDGKVYGFVPSFPRHQVINNRESDSCLPQPNEINTFDASATRASHDDHAAVGEGKGKEGKGREDVSLTLPDFVSQELWNAWIENRRRIKKPATANIQKIALAKIVKGHEEGFDVTAAMEATVERCWQTFFFEEGKTPKRKQEWVVEYQSGDEPKPEMWGLQQ